MSDAGNYDVVVIGAGAAGIGAGRRLAEAGVSAVMLEARDRLGGRAWTVPTALRVNLDLGCEWLLISHFALCIPHLQGPRSPT